MLLTCNNTACGGIREPNAVAFSSKHNLFLYMYHRYCYGRGVGTGGATGARAPLVLQQAKLTYKAYVGLSLRDPVGSADHMAQGVRDAIGIATQYSYIIVRHYLEL